MKSMAKALLAGSAPACLTVAGTAGTAYAARTGASQVLCVGRGSLPPELRQVLRVRIQPGTAPPCAYGPAAGS
ncbi:hypothetical protein [Nonomuraea jabiensis]|uniref:hypothetical protein n=1 Tax=Nonomuraea jabiensis TaxID=882448 RepID=UPI0036A1E9C0